MTNLTIPYASRAPFIRDDETPRLMQLAGQQRAEGMRRSGEIWGGAINSLGQLASGTIQQISEQKRADQMAKAKAAAEAPILADQAKLRALTIEKTQSELDAAKADRERQVKVGGAILGGGKRAQILEALKSDPLAYQMASEALDRQDTSLRRHFGELGATIRSFKDSPEAALLQLDLAEEDGFDPAKLAPLREMIKKDPKSVTGLVDSLLAKSGVPEFQKMVTPEAKAPEPFSLSPGQVRYGSDGKVIASVPREPKEPRVENKMWVMRPGEDGKMNSVFIPESQVRAGDRPASTREQGRPVTAGDAGRIAEIDNGVQMAKSLVNNLGTGTGSWLGSQVPDPITNATGFGAESKKQLAQIALVKQIIGKGLEGGVLRKEDEIKYAAILPKIGDAPDVAKAKMEGLIAALEQKREIELSAREDAGYDVSRFRQRSAPDAPLKGGETVAAPSKKKIRIVKGVLERY